MGKRPEADKRKADASNPKEDAIEVDGDGPFEPLPNAMFVVEFENKQPGSRAHFREDAQEFIRILAGTRSPWSFRLRSDARPHCVRYK